MQLTCTDVPGAPEKICIALTGEIDLAVAGQIKARIQQCRAERPGARHIVLDLDGVRFIDSTGIRELMYAQRDARAAGLTFSISRPHGLVREVLTITGVLAALLTPGGHPLAAGAHP